MAARVFAASPSSCSYLVGLISLHTPSSRSLENNHSDHTITKSKNLPDEHLYDRHNQQLSSGLPRQTLYTPLPLRLAFGVLGDATWSDTPARQTVSRKPKSHLSLLPPPTKLNSLGYHAHWEKHAKQRHCRIMSPILRTVLACFQD